MLQNINSGFTATEEFFSANDFDPLLFNDWGRHFPSIESEGVEVQSLSLAISDDEMEYLQSQIQPLRTSDSWGVDIYLETVLFLESLSF